MCRLVSRAILSIFTNSPRILKSIYLFAPFRFWIHGTIESHVTQQKHIFFGGGGEVRWECCVSHTAPIVSDCVMPLNSLWGVFAPFSCPLSHLPLIAFPLFPPLLRTGRLSRFLYCVHQSLNPPHNHNALQQTATDCNVLRHTATYLQCNCCNVLCNCCNILCGPGAETPPWNSYCCVHTHFLSPPNFSLLQRNCCNVFVAQEQRLRHETTNLLQHIVTQRVMTESLLLRNCCNILWHNTQLLQHIVSTAATYCVAQEQRLRHETTNLCSALQYAATNYRALQRIATHCNTFETHLQHIVRTRSRLRHKISTHCKILQRTATHYQHTAERCDILQNSATHCSKRSKYLSTRSRLRHKFTTLCSTL